MTDTRRYFCLFRWNGEIHSAVEYFDNPATVRAIKAGRAERREISIPEAMMGPTALVERFRLAREVRK